MVEAGPIFLPTEIHNLKIWYVNAQKGEISIPTDIADWNIWWVNIKKKCSTDSKF